MVVKVLCAAVAHPAVLATGPHSYLSSGDMIYQQRCQERVNRCIKEGLLVQLQLT